MGGEDLCLHENLPRMRLRRDWPALNHFQSRHQCVLVPGTKSCTLWRGCEPVIWQVLSHCFHFEHPGIKLFPIWAPRSTNQAQDLTTWSRYFTALDNMPETGKNLTSCDHSTKSQAGRDRVCFPFNSWIFEYVHVCSLYQLLIDNDFLLNPPPLYLTLYLLVPSILIFVFYSKEKVWAGVQAPCH